MKRVAYCTGFWSTNVGNAFFSLGVEYVLKRVFGERNVTLVSDVQTYTNSVGKRYYPHKKQLDYISRLDVDYVVLVGPVFSKYFLTLWKDALLKLEERGVRLIVLSAGIMKMSDEALKECQDFFEQHPMYILSSRDKKTFDAFGKYANHAYDGICFSFFAPDFYAPCPLAGEKPMVLNFDKIREPKVSVADEGDFEFNGVTYKVEHTGMLTKVAMKTDRFSDALIYVQSFLPQTKRADKIGEYTAFRTDHRFHPHFRRKIYSQNNSFCADLPFGYLNLYANAELVLSDRVHACAVTMAFGNSAMLFSENNRVGLLDRVGAGEISKHPVKLDLERLTKEKEQMTDWLRSVVK